MSPRKQRTDVRRIPVRMAAVLREKIGSRMEVEGYEPNRLSLWATEALTALVELEPDSVAALHLEVEGIAGNAKKVSAEFRLDDDLVMDLDAMLVHLRRLKPYVDWDRGRLIRGALRCRLEGTLISVAHE